MQQMIFIADLIACSTCFEHHYAHHQELESIIQVVAACRIWCFVFQAIRSAIKNHLLYLVGILFPHINDDARSKSHQIPRDLFELTGRYKYLTGYQGPHSWIFFCLWLEGRISFLNYTKGILNWFIKRVV